jgi:nucleoside-diphosphate-sugar epimerase
MVAARDVKVKRVVFAGSSSVYGETPTLRKCEIVSFGSCMVLPSWFVQTRGKVGEQEEARAIAAKAL